MKRKVKYEWVPSVNFCGYKVTESGCFGVIGSRHNRAALHNHVEDLHRRLQRGETTSLTRLTLRS
jgi:hypothetical protein